MSHVPGAPPRPLIVADDHAVVRAGISAALQDVPGVAIVAEVADGPGLFAALEHTRPAAIVIDVNMPGFAPIQAIHQIRALYPALKILVVSAYDDDVYVQGLLQAGVDGYHLKDQPLSDLRLALERIFAGERWVSSPLLSKLVRQPAPAASRLTQRQRELLWCLQQGDDNQSIARRMAISVKTVENHLTRLYRQLGVASRLEAVHYAAAHPDLPLALAASPAGATPPSILVVDDNTRYRAQMQRMIGAMYPHALIFEAANSEEALEVAAHERPQVALIDVVLGDEDGISCAERLRASLPALRMILISAYPDRAFHQRGLAIGAQALVDKKDLDRASLRAILDDLLPL